MTKKTLYIAAVAVLAAGQAYAARPVARWDVVPHQRISGVFNAGVVAFHEDGVKVTFDVGGRKFTAEEPKLNARTGVWEYFVPIDAAKCRSSRRAAMSPSLRTQPAIPPKRPATTKS